jgi:hypothetical protein
LRRREPRGSVKELSRRTQTLLLRQYRARAEGADIAVASVMSAARDRTVAAEDDVSSERVNIFGYGSLMSSSSARDTMPSLTSHRPGVLHGYERVFSLVSLSGIRNGSACMETKEIAALAVRPSSKSSVRGCLFEIKTEDFPAFQEREHRFVLLLFSLIQFIFSLK